MPDKIESFHEVDSSKYRLIARLGFVKLIRNELRKIKNLINVRLFRVKTCLRGEKMELDSRKKARRNKMFK